MKKNKLSILCEKSGKLSLKRVVGVTLIGTGLLGKVALNIYAATHIETLLANFLNIDNSFDSLIYSGIALLFGTIIDKFTKNDKFTKHDKSTSSDS
jgi:hypothetical protein